MKQPRGRTRRQFLQNVGLATVSSGALAALMSVVQSGCRKGPSRRPDIVGALTALLDQYRREGRSIPSRPRFR